jgi:DNA-binding transcriptional regulator YiaG
MPKPAALSTSFRERHTAWVEANPLRDWRLRQTPKVTILEAASMLGVGMSMVQMYERGVHKPTEDRTNIAAVLGTDWSKTWDRWLAAKPSI